jgi:Flp pilus assembly protein TadD
MSDEKRRNEVMVRLNDDELARLDELRRGVTPRAVYLRNLLREPPSEQAVADHWEALALLSEQARAGKVAAAVGLERALRGTPDDGSFDDDLARMLRD